MLIPAAGQSRRMRGADKLTQPVGGRPALAVMAARARAAGAPVLVTLPPAEAPHAAGRRAALDGLDVAVQAVPEAAEGMAASLRAGARMAAAGGDADAEPPREGTADGRHGGHSGLMVLLPDMPEIATADIAAMLARFEALPPPRPVLRATAADGAWGHPVILPAALFPAMAALHGDSGARDLLRSPPPLPHPLPGRRAVLDLDTPEAWAAWRATTPDLP